MPRLITTSRVESHPEPPDDPTTIDVGTAVHVQGFPSEPEVTAGVVAGSYYDQDRRAYLYVIRLDHPYEVRGGSYPMALSRIVVHPDALRIPTDVIIEEQAEAPSCADCGGDACGTTPDGRTMCDECALDLDITLTPYQFVVQAMVDAEEAAGEMSSRRRRQRTERLREVQASATDHLIERELRARFDAAIDTAITGGLASVTVPQGITSAGDGVRITANTEPVTANDAHRFTVGYTVDIPVTNAVLDDAAMTRMREHVARTYHAGDYARGGSRDRDY